MLPPPTGPSVSERRPHEIGVWARLESKSACSEADLVRLAETPFPGWDWSLTPVVESLVGWLLTSFDP